MSPADPPGIPRWADESSPEPGADVRVGPRAGRLQVIAGPMFAGKSEELMRRVRRARLAGLDAEVIVHALDDRHGGGAVASHIGTSIPARTAEDAVTLAGIFAERSRDLVAIDEAQFFGPGLLELVDREVMRGVDVIVAGLCITYDATPFEPLPALMARADEVVKLTAVCAVCGADAPFHVRRSGPSRALGEGITAPAEDGPERADPAFVGGAETYEARCRAHLPVGE